MLYNYIEATFEKNLSALVKSGPKPNDEKLWEHLAKINEEFAQLRGDANNTLMRNELITYKEELTLKVQFGWQLVHRLEMRVRLSLISPEIFEGLIAQLKAWGFRMNREKPIGEEIKKVVNELKAFQTTIDSMQAELFPDAKEDESPVESSKKQFYSILLMYQRILDIDKINPKKTSLMEFVVLEDSVKEVVKHRTKNTTVNEHS